MTSGPRVLMVTNESVAGSEAGFRDALDRLVAAAEIGAWAAAEPRAWLQQGEDWPEVVARTAQAARDLGPDIVLVLSPGGCPWRPDDVSTLLAAAGSGADVLYWEGDAWGGRKRANAAMDAWAARARTVFSVAGGSQARRLVRGGAADVRLVLQTYCQVQYREALTWSAEREPGGDRVDVLCIGNSAVRRWWIPPGVPGARQRRRVVTDLQREPLISFGVNGRGWSGPTALGALPYGQQVTAMRRSLVTVNWDHFPTLPSYSSDRLPISMLAGRVHVTTRHPATPWLPGEAEGLVLVERPDDVRPAVRRLVRAPAADLIDLGRRAHAWVLGRCSDVEAMRHMLSSVAEQVAPPPADPWAALPALV